MFECSNQVAYDTAAFDFKPYRPGGSSQTLGPFIYTLDKDTLLTIELDTIEKYHACVDEIHTTVEPTIVVGNSFVTM